MVLIELRRGRFWPVLDEVDEISKFNRLPLSTYVLQQYKNKIIVPANVSDKRLDLESSYNSIMRICAILIIVGIRSKSNHVILDQRIYIKNKDDDQLVKSLKWDINCRLFWLHKTLENELWLIDCNQPWQLSMAELKFYYYKIHRVNHNNKVQHIQLEESLRCYVILLKNKIEKMKSEVWVIIYA